MAEQTSLYERLGGEPAIMATVDRFYQKLIADERTRRFFAGIDLAAQARKQISFMSWAFGGPAEYRGRDLRSAHRRLVAESGLSDEHFDAVAEHLEASLNELGVPAAEVSEVLANVAATRDEVLDR